jgi:Kef-type K+ transport system membrane component KefB
LVQIYIQLSLVILVVLGVSLIMRLLKQPLIIGYILAGILIGPIFLNLIPAGEVLDTFSQIGIAFLLFIVGLYLNPRVVKEAGKISVITGIGQVVFTSIIGYAICMLLGFSNTTSIYIAVALTFSSTIVVMKLLSDKEALDKLYGRITIGLLLVQDLMAIMAVIIISSLSGQTNSWSFMLILLAKGVGAFLVLFAISYFLFPRLTSFFEKSQEFLFVFALGWGFGLSALFLYIGFSIEVGALIAGILLSMFPYSHEVSSRLKPLRDFFLISFFILLGSQIIFSEVQNMIIPAIVLSLFVLIGNPLIVMVIMGLFGYSRSTGFMTGVAIAQVSEFSLVLIALGVRMGHIPSSILSFVTIIALITIAGSSYLITFSDKIYSHFSKTFSIFEKKRLKEKEALGENYEYFLFGENRIGFSIMKLFMNTKKDYLIVDFNPERVKKLSSKGIPCVYGDVSDVEFLDELKVYKAKLIVSTVPEKETNMTLLNLIHKKNKDTIIIVTARHITEAFDLYKAGADYVILPHFLGGKYTSDLIERAKNNKDVYKEEKEKQIKDLKERLGEGQEHPNIDRT